MPTIGETINGYTPPGIPDAMGACEMDDEARLLFLNVQAHSLRGGAIDGENLVQGGQFEFLSKAEEDDDGDDDDD